VKARLRPTGPAVGILPDAHFGVQQVQLDPGDTLLAFTDGVPEARDPAGKFFTEQRLLSLLTEPAGSVSDVLGRVEAHLRAHISTAPQFDDITLLGVRRAPPS
jgi:sigma-B regulation protein RsbU (phosphoserine phosphatase)